MAKLEFSCYSLRYKSISLRVRLYSAHAPITGSSRELGSTPRGGFLDFPQSPVNRLDGTQVMSMRLKKVCPQCDATLHARKLACPCSHVFPKRKRPIESRQSDYVTQVPVYNAEGFALQCFHCPVCLCVCPRPSSATRAIKRQTRHTGGLSIVFASV